MSDEAFFLVPRESGSRARAGVRPLNGQGAAHFLGHVAGLVIREVILTPELCGSGTHGGQPSIHHVQSGTHLA
jgi:hypothetical protein